MSRIDEIKEQLDQFKRDLVASRGCCDIHDFSDDVQYLLSKLEEADKALENIKDMIGEEFADKTQERCTKALQQLRS